MAPFDPSLAERSRRCPPGSYVELDCRAVDALRRPAGSFHVVAGALTLVNFSEFSAMPQP
jgi:hypothetical protein